MTKPRSSPTTSPVRGIGKRPAPVNRPGSAAQWREANRDAIDAYNQEIAQRGSFGDLHRRF